MGGCGAGMGGGWIGTGSIVGWERVRWRCGS